MIVVCARESPRSAIISARSRKLSLYRRYQRTQSTMISWSKCRPLKSPSIFVCARQLCRSTDLPTTMLCPSSSHQSLATHQTFQRGGLIGREMIDMKVGPDFEPSRDEVDEAFERSF